MQSNKLTANRIRDLRIAHGYTQDFVASSLDIARQTYSHYENGRRTPPYDVMLKLADMYNISLDDLDEKSDRNTDTSVLFDFIDFYNDPDNKQKYRYLNRNEKELLYLYKHIQENYRWELIEFARILARKK